MRRTEAMLLGRLLATGDGAPSIDEKLELLRSAQSHSPELAEAISRQLLDRCERLTTGLTEAQSNQGKLKELLEQFTMPPLHPAVYLDGYDTAEGRRALVMHGGTRLVVGVPEGVDADALAPGDEVMLGSEMNVIIATSPYGAERCGETALFERRAGDNHIILKWREEQVVVRVAGSLRDCTLKVGDLVRWDRTCSMAYEKIERTRDTNLFLEDTPAETFDNIGGLDEQIDALKRTITLHMKHPDVVRMYRGRQRKCVLLVGPPGTGKTMTARAFANWLATLSPAGKSRFMNIKPGQLLSMWYGQTPANYREVFRVAREAGAENPDVPVVMLFDEVDSTASARGQSLTRADDRTVQAFMHELDGMEDLGNVIVLAATNRRDALDSALLRPGRFGDLVIEVPRPGMDAARDIFGKYLLGDLPYATDGGRDDQEGIRREIIDAATSSIYAPNGDADLATITFRDNTRRTVTRSDLTSGAVIAGIAAAGIERAMWRHATTGRAGIRLEDVLEALHDEFTTAAAALTPANCRNHVGGLPQDADVVSVKQHVRKVRPHRYLTLSVA